MLKKKPIFLITFVILTTTFVSGCLWAPELDQIRRDFESQLPGSRFKKEFTLSLGPLSLGVAKMVTRFIPDAHDARSYLQEVRKVKVAVYEIEEMPSEMNLKTPGKLTHLLESDDWEIAARIREDDEHVWVLYRERRGSVEELFVVVLDDSELVLVRASGRFDRIVEKAIQEHYTRGDLSLRSH